MISHCSPTLKYLDTKYVDRIQPNAISDDTNYHLNRIITEEERKKASQEFPEAQQKRKNTTQPTSLKQSSSNSGVDIFSSITAPKKQKKANDDVLGLFGDNSFSVSSSQTSTKTTKLTNSANIPSIYSRNTSSDKKIGSKNLASSLFGDDIFSSSPPTKKKDTMDDIFASKPKPTVSKQEDKPKPVEDDDFDIDNIQVPDDIFGEVDEVPDDIFGDPEDIASNDIDIDEDDEIIETKPELNTDIKDSDEPIESDNNEIQDLEKEEPEDIHDPKFDISTISTPVEKPKTSSLAAFEDQLFGSSKSSSKSLFDDDDDDFMSKPVKKSTKDIDLFDDSQFTIPKKQPSSPNIVAEPQKQEEEENEDIVEESPVVSEENVESIKEDNSSSDIVETNVEENIQEEKCEELTFKDIIERETSRCFVGNGLSTRVLFSAIDDEVSFLLEVSESGCNYCDSDDNYDCSVDALSINTLLDCFTSKKYFAAALLDDSLSTDDPIRLIAFLTAFYFTPSNNDTQISLESNNVEEEDVNSSKEQEEQKRLEEELKRKEQEELEEIQKKEEEERMALLKEEEERRRIEKEEAEKIAQEEEERRKQEEQERLEEEMRIREENQRIAREEEEKRLEEERLAKEAEEKRLEEERLAKEAEEKRLEEERLAKEEEERRLREEEEEKRRQEEEIRQQEIQKEKDKWGPWYDMHCHCPELTLLIINRFPQCGKDIELPNRPFHFVFEIEEKDKKYNIQVSYLQEEILVIPCSSDESGHCKFSCTGDSLTDVLNGTTSIGVALMMGQLLPKSGIDNLSLFSEGFDFSIPIEELKEYSELSKPSSVSVMVNSVPKVERASSQTNIEQ